VTSWPSRRRASAAPATWSLTSCGCDHANGVTRQMRRPTVRDCRAGGSLSARGDYAHLMSDVVIQVRRNGPYKVTGPITVIDAEGREFELPAGTAVALCRCGHSRTKPFCDATHREIGFVADDVASRAG
jgi:CDGSH iron-sulfur domain-containing protein 3